MGETFLITRIKGRQILDSRGNPTVEAEVMVSWGRQQFLPEPVQDVSRQ